MFAKYAGTCRCGSRFLAGVEITYERTTRATTACPACAVKAPPSVPGETVQVTGDRGAVYDVTLTATATSTPEQQVFLVAVGRCRLGTVSQVTAHSRGDRSHAAHGYAAWSSVDTAGKMGIPCIERAAAIRALVIADPKRIAREE